MVKYINDICVGPKELCSGIENEIYKIGAIFETERDLRTDMQVVGRDCYLLTKDVAGNYILDHMPKDYDDKKGDYKGIIKPEHIKPHILLKVVTFGSTLIKKSE